MLKNRERNKAEDCKVTFQTIEIFLGVNQDGCRGNSE